MNSQLTDSVYFALVFVEHWHCHWHIYDMSVLQSQMLALAVLFICLSATFIYLQLSSFCAIYSHLYTKYCSKISVEVTVERLDIVS